MFPIVKRFRNPLKRFGLILSQSSGLLFAFAISSADQAEVLEAMHSFCFEQTKLGRSRILGHSRQNYANEGHYYSVQNKLTLVQFYFGSLYCGNKIWNATRA